MPIGKTTKQQERLMDIVEESIKNAANTSMANILSAFEELNEENEQLGKDLQSAEDDRDDLKRQLTDADDALAEANNTIKELQAQLEASGQ